MKKISFFIIISFLFLSVQMVSAKEKNKANINYSHGSQLDNIKKSIELEKINIPILPAERKLISNNIENLSNSENFVQPLDSGDGVNNMPFTYFDYGDMAFMTNPDCNYYGYACYWKHMALFDSDYDTGSESDRALWSAYPDSQGVCDSEPDVCDKVGRQSKSSVHNWYDRAHGQWDSYVSYSDRVNTTWYAYYQRGEPFYSFSSKSSESSWYCSKLSWKAYQVEASTDLDSDGGLIVFPDDVYVHSDLSLFAYGD